MHREPTTPRGKRTFATILAGAVRAFGEKGYHATSVSEVCRTAGVANGTFYQYFPDKVDVFNELVRRISHDFLAAIDGATSSESATDRLFDFFEAHGHAFQIFREAEFLDVPHPLAAFYQTPIERLAEVLGVDEAEAWAFLGGLTMTALFVGVWPGKAIGQKTREAFLDVARHGIAPAGRRRVPRLVLGGEQPAHAAPGPTPGPKPEGRAERTRAELIRAARSCFAKEGYANTHIVHITQAAETALGTFYVHFREKRDILAEVTTQIRAQMQGEVARACQGLSDRLAVEERAFAVFLGYLQRHHEIYRIVREAEFAEPDIGQSYYQEIWKRWSDLAGQAMSRGELRAADPRVTAAFLMGSESHAGMRWILWEPSHTPPPEAMQATWAFLCRGLAGCSPETQRRAQSP